MEWRFWVIVALLAWSGWNAREAHHHIHDIGCKANIAYYCQYATHGAIK